VVSERVFGYLWDQTENRSTDKYDQIEPINVLSLSFSSSRNEDVDSRAWHPIRERGHPCLLDTRGIRLSVRRVVLGSSEAYLHNY
jgi:hypothetical protein